jgi:hypothetical protein
MQRWQHCKLVGKRVRFVGASGLFEDKSDSHLGERSAWSRLEHDGWELVAAVPDPQEDGELAFFFKRPAPRSI